MKSPLRSCGPGARASSPLPRKLFPAWGSLSPATIAAFAVARPNAGPVPTSTPPWRTSRTVCPPGVFRRMPWSPRSTPTPGRSPGRKSTRSSRMLRLVTCWSVGPTWSNGTRTWRPTPRRPCWRARKSPAGNWWRAGASAPLPTRTPPSRPSLPPVMMRPWCMTASPRPSPSWRNSWARPNLRRRLAAM